MNVPVKSTMNSTGPKLIKNNLLTNGELKIKIVTTADGAKTNLLLITSPVVDWLKSKLSCTTPDQAECKISSTVSADNSAGFLQLQAYLSLVGMHVKGIRIQTSDTTLYNGSLMFGEIGPNGIPSPSEITLATYATTIGGGGTYDKMLTIDNIDLALTKNFYMYLTSVPASATITMALIIDAISDTITVG